VKLLSAHSYVQIHARAYITLTIVTRIPSANTGFFFQTHTHTRTFSQVHTVYLCKRKRTRVEVAAPSSRREASSAFQYYGSNVRSPYYLNDISRPSPIRYNYLFLFSLRFELHFSLFPLPARAHSRAIIKTYSSSSFTPFSLLHFFTLGSVYNLLPFPLFLFLSLTLCRCAFRARMKCLDSLFFSLSTCSPFIKYKVMKSIE